MFFGKNLKNYFLTKHYPTHHKLIFSLLIILQCLHVQIAVFKVLRNGFSINIVFYRYLLLKFNVRLLL